MDKIVKELKFETCYGFRWLANHIGCCMCLFNEGKRTRMLSEKCAYKESVLDDYRYYEPKNGLRIMERRGSYPTMFRILDLDGKVLFDWCCYAAYSDGKYGEDAIVIIDDARYSVSRNGEIKEQEEFTRNLKKL